MSGYGGLPQVQVLRGQCDPEGPRLEARNRDSAANARHRPQQRMGEGGDSGTRIVMARPYP